MKKPYVKNCGKHSGFDVWIVDGKYVRTFIEEEFTNFGQHFRFNFIPENEFWIDAEHGNHGEEKYYIHHLLVENRLMKAGKNYSQALESADVLERAERGKLEFVRNMLDGKDNKHVIEKIHKKLLKKYSSKTNVWVVRGDLVRDLF